MNQLSGRLKSHQACAKGLGLKKIHKTVEVIDTPENRKNMPDADHGGWVTLEGLSQNIEKLLLSKENGLLLEI